MADPYAFLDCYGMVMFGWKPLATYNFTEKERAAYLVYMQLMTTDEKWKEIIKMKMAARL